MASKSKEAFVFGDVVRTLDGRGPIMLVTDAAPTNQLPFMILCQYWADDALRVVAVHAGLLESCEPPMSRPKREPLASFFELVGPVVTVLVEAVDLMAAVQSGRSKVVSVDDEPEASGSPDVKSPIDDSPDCRAVWLEIFGGKTPLAVFAGCQVEEREKLLASSLALERAAFLQHRPVVVADLQLLIDFALVCGHQLDRAKAVDYLNRILDARLVSDSPAKPEHAARAGYVNNGHT